MNFLVLHGPNLNLLGERPGDPPHPTLTEVNAEIQRRAIELGVLVRALQSNHEGALVDALHEQRQWFHGVILNPAALGATSYALRDALSAVAKPAYEVHMEGLRKMEAWKRKSVLKDVCAGQLVGKGVGSYLVALERLVALVKKQEATKEKKSMGRALRGADANKPSAPKALMTKTLGRRPTVASSTVAPEPLKTLGKVSAPLRPSKLGFLTRELVRQKIAERLSGTLSPAGLATWARSQWQEVQRGAAAESGQRDLLEDLLQSLFLATVPNHALSDDQLIELMTRLDG